MSVHSGIRTALGNIVGDVGAFLALRGRHVIEAESACGGQVAVERCGFADVVRVSHHVSGRERFAGYVVFDGKEKKGTLEWKCSPDASIKDVFSAGFETSASPTQVSKLESVLRAPKPIDPACLSYTVCEAARILGVGKSTLYDAISRNEVPVVRIGSRIRVPRGSLMNSLLPGN